jgi:hypothetical protein
MKPHAGELNVAGALRNARADVSRAAPHGPNPRRPPSIAWGRRSSRRRSRACRWTACSVAALGGAGGAGALSAGDSGSAGGGTGAMIRRTGALDHAPGRWHDVGPDRILGVGAAGGLLAGGVVPRRTAADPNCARTRPRR